MEIPPNKPDVLTTKYGVPLILTVQDTISYPVKTPFLSQDHPIKDRIDP